MIRCVSFDEYKKIMNEVHKNHCLIKGRCIKYIDTTFDMRTYGYWRWEFRGFAETKEFTTANRGIGQPEQNINLFDEIMDWLKEGRKS